MNILMANSKRDQWPGGTASLPAFPAGASSPDVFAINVNDPQHAGNVAVVRDGKPVKITHEGDDTLANIKLGEVRVVNWTAKDGTKLEGIATFPSNFSAGQKSKFLVLPHGGPESNDESALDLFARFLPGWVMWCCSRNIADRPDTARIFSPRSISTSATAPTRM